MVDWGLSTEDWVLRKKIEDLYLIRLATLSPFEASKIHTNSKILTNWTNPHKLKNPQKRLCSYEQVVPACVYVYVYEHARVKTRACHIRVQVCKLVKRVHGTNPDPSVFLWSCTTDVVLYMLNCLMSKCKVLQAWHLAKPGVSKLGKKEKDKREGLSKYTLIAPPTMLTLFDMQFLQLMVHFPSAPVEITRCPKKCIVFSYLCFWRSF